MNASKKNELSLECMILMALLDQKMQPEEIELLRNFSKEHELEEHYKQVDREYNNFSQEKIKKELLSRSDQFESEEDRFHLLCHLSEIVTCDRDISPDEQEVLSQIEKNFNSNFGFRAPSSLDFDAEQREVIDAERFDKFIVDAKAGSGKTEVIPERIMKLVKKDHVLPNSIWMISFSRAAVSEMRSRILARWGRFPKDLIITTLDSRGFVINHAFDFFEDSSSMKFDLFSYEYSINLLLENLREGNRELKDFMRSLRHVLIDEAQDIVGERRDSCVEIINQLHQECGVTILGDQAQAIFGWTLKKDVVDKRSLLELALNNEINHDKWKKLEFKNIYRSSNNKILDLVENTRKIVLDDSKKPKEKYTKLMKELIQTNEFETKSMHEVESSMDQDSMLLDHMNEFILDVSKDMLLRKHNFRIKKAILPNYYLAWIALIADNLAQSDNEYFTIHEFKNFYLKNFTPQQKKKLTFWNTWSTLLYYGEDDACKQKVSIEKLRNSLSFPYKPLNEFANSGFGNTGPILGTVHTLKGTEADTVFYKLPTNTPYRTNLEEQIKVIFVALSRVRKRMFFVSDDTVTNKWVKIKKYSKEKTFQRYWSVNRLSDPLNAKRMATFFMEVGIEGDYDPVTIVSHYDHDQGYVRKLDEIKRTQEFLKRLAQKNVHQLGKYDVEIKELFFEYKIYLKEPETGFKHYLGCFNPDVSQAITGSGGVLPQVVPNQWVYRGRKFIEVRNIRIMDIASYALEENPEEAIQLQLYPHFLRRGYWLYPVIYGLGPWYFDKGAYNDRSRWNG